MPSNAIISVGTDNSYGHPDEDTLSRLRDANVKVYRTDMQGDVIINIDQNGNMVITTQRNQNVQTNPTIPSGASSYIGNINSKIFHLPSCSSLPAMQNRVSFSRRSEAINQGYTPCGRCKP